ncbi:uncharacterized protein G2W53_017997 [Senna tora]|uniref:Uncharacterized protein n=1 Tax=Senna tora TaxID=362788 RepID=A0A834WMZ5_9FABA|nr:uncharacterized protein G2W53_017997 [Senna tora]
MTRTELFKVLCDKGLTYPSPGKIWTTPFSSWFKVDWLCISIIIFLGVSSPHLRHRRMSKENRRDVDVGTKDGQKKSHIVYSV